MKLSRKLAPICTVLSSLLFASSTAFGFGSETHEAVTSYSLKDIINLYSESGENILQNGNEKNILNEITGNYKDIIISGSLKPDDDENKGGFKYHFYNPITERNYMGEKENAVYKCKTHYEQAIKNYKLGDKNVAYEELGRAIHFLEDSNTPVHTGYDNPTDSVVKLPLHVRFEKKCDIINDKCQATVTLDALAYFKYNSVENIAIASSILALDNFYRLDNKVDNNEEEIAKSTVLNAQKKVIGLIYKFICDVCV